VTSLLLPFRAELSIWQANFSIAARIDLGPFGVSGTVPSYTIATKLVVLSVLSCRTIAIVVSVVAEPVVVLRLRDSEAEDSEEDESRAQHFVDVWTHDKPAATERLR